MNSQELLLRKGQYLAPVYRTYPLENLLVGITEYPSPIQTGVWHAHEKPLISFVLEGGNLENRKGSQIERFAGCTNFYFAHEPHQNTYKKFPSKHFSIEIENHFLKKHNLTEAEIYLAVNRYQVHQVLLIKILKEALQNDLQSASSVELLFLELIHKSLAVKDTRVFPVWMKTIYEILNDRWNETLVLQELAQEANVHPVTISKYFSQYFSCTLGDYMRKLKVMKAMHLIRSSDQPLTEIAYFCGFADQSHFIRTFKYHTGFSPKQYQKL